MIRTGRLLFTLYLSVTLYLLLSLVNGPSGINATENLKAYKAVLAENITELKDINKDLIRKCKPYNEMNTIKLRAYEMGYLNKDQKIIHLKGIVKSNISHSLGKIIYRDTSGINHAPFIRSVSLIFSLLFYIFSSIFLTGTHGTKKIRK
jgi:cell division protein FtsB